MANTPNIDLYVPSKADNGVNVVQSLADNFGKIDTELGSVGTQLADVANPELVTYVDNTDSGINYIGSWVHNTSVGNYNDTRSESNITNNTLTFTFNGTSIDVYGTVGANKGIVEILIDGVSKGNFDMYLNTYVQKYPIAKFDRLSKGSHTIEIRITGNKHASSTGTYFSFDYFKVVNNSMTSVSSRMSDIATVYVSDYKTDSNTWTEAIEDAINALPYNSYLGDLGQLYTGKNYSGIVKLPEGVFKIDGIVTDKFPYFKGAGANATMLQHNNGISSPMIHFTNGITWGGVSDMTMVAGDLTTSFIKASVTIDNQGVFDDLSFQGTNSTVICHGFEVADYLNWSIGRIRADHLTGYMFKVLAANIKLESYFHVKDFTLDNGTEGDPRGQGVFYMDTSGRTLNFRKGTVTFENARIELNSPLNAPELFRFVQKNESTYVNAIYSINVNIEKVNAYASNGIKFITCNGSTQLLVKIDSSVIRGFKEIYNNDNQNATNAIQSHNQNNYVTVGNNRLANWSFYPYNLNAQYMFLNRSIYNAPNLTTAQTGYYKNGDIILIDDLSTSPAYIGYVAWTTGAKGFRACNTQNGWSVDTTVGSAQVNIVDAGFNVGSNKLFIGMEITINGAGAAGAQLQALIKDINFDNGNKYIILDTAAGTAVTNTMCRPAVTTLKAFGALV